MQVELDGEIRAVTRHRRGVMWCPFCDRSRQDVGGEQWCDGCKGKFSDEAIEVVGDVAPRRRGRPPREETVATPDQEEVEE
jgi:hypothetical protein